MRSQSPKLVWLQFETRGTLVGKERGCGTRASAPGARLVQYHRQPFPVTPAAPLPCPSLPPGTAAPSFHADGETEARGGARIRVLANLGAAPGEPGAARWSGGVGGEGAAGGLSRSPETPPTTARGFCACGCPCWVHTCVHTRVGACTRRWVHARVCVQACMCSRELCTHRVCMHVLLRRACTRV